MATKSKLDIAKLQEQFDEILKNLTKESVLSWLEQDKENQCALMLKGNKISAFSEQISYTITTFNFEKPKEVYDTKQAA